MRLMSKWGCALLVCIATAGCITSETLVKVKADGSGTIEQSISMKKEAADQLQAMMAGFGGPTDQGKAARVPELFSEKEMREAAPKLGEGVTFVSSKPIAAPGRTGRVAIYKFLDIAKVHVDQRPTTPGGAQGGIKQSGAPEEIGFAFARLPNGHSQLSILFPEPKLSDKKPDSRPTAGQPKKGAAPDAAQLEMMKKVFEGLKIDLAVEVAGPIVKTNSAYVEGNRVTLLQMDFEQLLQNQDQLSRMTEPKSIEEAKAALKNIKGFKINVDKTVTIEFAAK